MILLIYFKQTFTFISGPKGKFYWIRLKILSASFRLIFVLNPSPDASAPRAQFFNHRTGNNPYSSQIWCFI